MTNEQTRLMSRLDDIEERLVKIDDTLENSLEGDPRFKLELELSRFDSRLSEIEKAIREIKEELGLE